MLSRFLSIASPFSIYITLATLAWAIVKARRRWEWFALVPATLALAASLLLIPAEHKVYFDEDIYIHMASNLAHAPVAQVALLGTPQKIETSAYYKEPAGYPALLSLIFIITGPSENVAFLLARLIYAAAVASVYLLGRAVFVEHQDRKKALVAALIFAAMPMCLGLSSAASTDLPAALFAVIGFLGIFAGSGPLAAAGFAMAAQTRLETIVLLPVLLMSKHIDRKWKVLGVALAAVECLHILWVISIMPALAEAAHVTTGFTVSNLAENSAGILRYLLNPSLYPTLVLLAAIAAVGFRKKTPQWRTLVAWGLLAMFVYPIVKDGSFQRNPRYSIAISAPVALLAASTFPSPLSYGFITILLPYFTGGDDEKVFREDHEAAVALAKGLGPTDLVVTAEPELFLNQGTPAMNSLFASERKEKLNEQFNRYTRLIYYAGTRTFVPGSKESEVDVWLKSAFELRPMGSESISGGRIAWYELLKPGNRQTR